MKKITLGQLFHWCWFVFFGIAYLCFCVHIDKLAVCLPMGLALFILVVFLLIKRKETIQSLASRPFTYVVMGILMLIGLLLAGRAMLIAPFNDSGTIWYSVVEIVENGSVSKIMDEYTACGWSTHTSNHDYFLVYPNSRFMVSFLLPFGYLLRCIPEMDLRSETAYYCLVCLNICFILASTAFVLLTARKEKGDIAAFLVMLGSLMFLPYYLNAYKLYSDTLSLPFVSLALLLTVLADHSEKKSLVLRFFAGIVVAVGILLKGSIWVLAIALCIYIVVKQHGWKQKVQHVLCVLLGVLIVTQTWSLRSAHLPWLDTTQEDRYKMPAMHWVMMSSHGNGGFYQEDLDFSLGFETYEERETAVANKYIQRVKEHGLLGYLNFLRYKVSMAFADGTFCQMVHLDRFENHIIGKLVCPTSPYFPIISIYANTILCLIYFAVLVSGILNARGNKDGLELALNVCLFGCVLFFSLWEAKSRYLLNFTPIYLLIVSFSVVDLAAFFGNRGKDT